MVNLVMFNEMDFKAIFRSGIATPRQAVMLCEEIERLREKHADEINRMQKEHADEINRMPTRSNACARNTRKKINQMQNLQEELLQEKENQWIEVCNVKDERIAEAEDLNKKLEEECVTLQRLIAKIQGYLSASR